MLDGAAAGTRTVTRGGGVAVLAVRGFRPFTPAERTDIGAESAALLAFLHPRDTPDVRIV